ncbi:hypothetical protein FHG87_001653 [Trinorchestia longiramus]|nr:hypothetical protein FHG87_001653 [Trinorchestia longiramus]
MLHRTELLTREAFTEIKVQCKEERLKENCTLYGIFKSKSDTHDLTPRMQDDDCSTCFIGQAPALLPLTVTSPRLQPLLDAQSRYICRNWQTQHSYPDST